MSNPEIMWSKAFAWNATNKNTIQEQRQPSQDVQDATLNDGFPLITMTPQEAGGVAPNGQDMNGALYAISLDMVHRQKGLRIQFDPAYAAKIGGYDQGCILASSDYTRDYISLIPNNLTDPNGSGTAGRWAIYSGAGSIASATASIAGIVKIVDSLSSTATDAALTANQGKVLGDRTQQATTANVGISRFANASEVANRSDSNVAINPSNVGQTFGASLSENGWCRLPNGLILQWGSIDYASNPGEISVDVVFPAMFAVSCLNITATRKSLATNLGDGVVALVSKTRESAKFQLNTWGDGTSGLRGFSWFAIGY